jgi:hypothetical protein
MFASNLTFVFIHIVGAIPKFKYSPGTIGPRLSICGHEVCSQQPGQESCWESCARSWSAQNLNHQIVYNF